MKSIIIFLLGFAVSYGIYGQEVISSSGNSYTNSLIQIDFTIGEVLIESFSVGDNFITQGFQQPKNRKVLGFNTEIYGLEIYPNPVLNLLIVKMKESDRVLSFQVLDIQGNILDKGIIELSESQINFTKYHQGVYLLRIIDSANKINTYKILKTN